MCCYEDMYICIYFHHICHIKFLFLLLHHFVEDTTWTRKPIINSRAHWEWVACIRTLVRYVIHMYILQLFFIASFIENWSHSWPDLSCRVDGSKYCNQGNVIIENGCICGGVIILGIHHALILVVKMNVSGISTIFASCFFFSSASSRTIFWNFSIFRGKLDASARPRITCLNKLRYLYIMTFARQESPITGLSLFTTAQYSIFFFKFPFHFPLCYLVDDSSKTK